MMTKLAEETVDKAIWAHSRWKSHLQSAIVNGQSEFSVKEARDPRSCQFGKWLYSAEGKELPNLKEVIDLHEKFHVEAAKVLTLAITGHAEEAKAKLQLGSDFSRLTARLVEALVKAKTGK